MPRYLKKLIQAKREAEQLADETSAPLCPQFHGWHARGYLPHYDAPGVIQMITYRLEDAMPASLRHEWEALFQIEDERLRRTKIEAYLDLGRGACHLRDPSVATLVENGWLHFDGQRYRLLAWVVMPNHVHALLEVWEAPLPDLVRSWKSYTSKEANRLLKRSGRFWQEDYWDRYIRDEGHCSKAIHYTEWNAVKAGLVNAPELWPFSSANAKWKWSADVPSARYTQGAHVVHKNWERFERRADETSALLSPPDSSH